MLTKQNTKVNIELIGNTSSYLTSINCVTSSPDLVSVSRIVLILFP